MAIFKFETLNDRQSGGRSVAIVAGTQAKATEAIKLDPGETIVKVWRNGKIVFDPFAGQF
jgi:hypothetical protein